jgi:hypothetical protein
MRIASLDWLVTAVALTSQTACVKPPPPVNVFRMGDRVQVGPLVYTIFEADWRAKLGEGGEVRLPAQRFLIVHLSVTNGSSEALSMPALSLVDDTGHAYTESMDGQNVSSWFGLSRKLKPVETREGRILFDVEPKSYKLKLDDDTNTGAVSMVEMPLRFDVEKPAIPSALESPVR